MSLRFLYPIAKLSGLFFSEVGAMVLAEDPEAMNPKLSTNERDATRGQDSKTETKTPLI